MGMICWIWNLKSGTAMAIPLRKNNWVQACSVSSAHTQKWNLQCWKNLSENFVRECKTGARGWLAGCATGDMHPPDPEVVISILPSTSKYPQSILPSTSKYHQSIFPSTSKYQNSFHKLFLFSPHHTLFAVKDLAPRERANDDTLEASRRKMGAA